MYDETRIALGDRGVVTVTVDAMGVVGQRRESEGQRGIDQDVAARILGAGRMSSTVRRNRWGRATARARMPINKVLPFDNTVSSNRVANCARNPVVNRHKVRPFFLCTPVTDEVLVMDSPTRSGSVREMRPPAYPRARSYMGAGTTPCEGVRRDRARSAWPVAGTRASATAGGAPN
jgi:hypothetical protein